MRAGKYHKICREITSERIFFPIFLGLREHGQLRRRNATRVRLDQLEKNSRWNFILKGAASPVGVALMSNTRISVPLIETSPM